MAKQTITTLIDDLDGSEGSESISFSYRGVSYTIDLSEKNAAAFDKAMAKYVDSATRESGRRQASTRGAAPANGRRTDLADIRTWATDNGYEVSGRGRIASEIIAAYDAAH